MRSVGILLAAVTFAGAVAGDIHIPQGFAIVELRDHDEGDAMRARLNDRGQCVYMTGSYGIGLDSEVYYYDHGQTVRLTADDIVDRDPDINNASDLVWVRNIGPEDRWGWASSEIVFYRNGELLRLTDDAFDDSGPRINNLGHIVWTRHFNDGSSVYFYDGQEVREITASTRRDFAAAINDRDEVVLIRSKTVKNREHRQVVLWRDGAETVINPDDVETRGADLRANGDVVWVENAGDCLDYLWTFSGGESTLFNDNGALPRTNLRGDVGFYRFHTDHDLPGHEDNTFQAWLSHSGGLLAVTDDQSIYWNWLDDINERGEFVLFSGDNEGTWTGQIFLVYRAGPRGDLNCDNRVDFADIDGFVQALTDLAGYFREFPECDAWYADIDGNGTVEFDDIDPFVECLIQSGCD